MCVVLTKTLLLDIMALSIAKSTGNLLLKVLMWWLLDVIIELWCLFWKCCSEFFKNRMSDISITRTRSQSNRSKRHDVILLWHTETFHFLKELCISKKDWWVNKFRDYEIQLTPNMSRNVQSYFWHRTKRTLLDVSYLNGWKTERKINIRGKPSLLFSYYIFSLFGNLTKIRTTLQDIKLLKNWSNDS